MVATQLWVQLVGETLICLLFCFIFCFSALTLVEVETKVVLGWKAPTFDGRQATSRQNSKLFTQLILWYLQLLLSWKIVVAWFYTYVCENLVSTHAYINVHTFKILLNSLTALRLTQWLILFLCLHFRQCNWLICSTHVL